MQHFIGILTPREDFPEGDDRQKPFFGPEWRVTRTERDKPTEPAPESKPVDPFENFRFATLLSPPYI